MQWPWRSKPDAVLANQIRIACPGCKRDDRFVLVAQFHSIDATLTVRVESVRVACEKCHGQWDLSRSGAAIEVRLARVEQERAQGADTNNAAMSEREAERTDTDLRGLYGKGRR
jgi:hypothetical protein